MPCDNADESCVANAIGNLCQSFLLSYGVRVGIRFCSALSNSLAGNPTCPFLISRIYGIVSCPLMFVENVEKERGTNECDLADAVDQEDIAKLSDAVKELNSMRLMTQLTGLMRVLTSCHKACCLPVEDAF